ncbi:MAG: alpha/beta fold hydrolase [Thermoplasmata archaeon]
MPEPVSPPVELYAREEGSGPTVVLLHGLGGDHQVWNDVIPLLSGQFRVIAPDLRGHGRSPDGEASRFSFEELEGDLLQLLERRGIPRCHLVGLSAGGFLALRMALDHPSRLASLTVLAASARCDPHTKEVCENWTKTYETEGRDALLLLLVKDLYYPDWIEAHLDYLDQLRTRFDERSFRAVARWGRAIQSFDLRGRLLRIRIPTLIIQAMDDRVVDGSHGRFLRQSIPGSELRLFRDTGHMIPVERSAETAEAISGFLHTFASASGGAGPIPPSP